MSMNSSGRGCRSKSHRDTFPIYEALPRAVRDKIKIARTDLCCGCLRNKLRRYGIDFVLDNLDNERRFRREKRGREVWYVPELDLRP